MTIFQASIKNFRILMRSRSSATIILIAPLLIVLLFGLSVSNDDQYVPIVGLVDAQQTVDSAAIGDAFREEFKTHDVDDLQTCIRLVRSGEHDVCALFSHGFTIGSPEQSTITLFIDESKIHLVDFVSTKLGTLLNKKSKELSESFAAAYVKKLDRISEVASADVSVQLYDLSTTLTTIKKQLSGVSETVQSIDASQTGQASTEDVIALSQDLYTSYDDLVFLFNDTLENFGFLFENMKEVAGAPAEVYTLANRGIDRVNDSNLELSQASSTVDGDLPYLLNQLLSDSRSLSAQLAIAENKRADASSSLDSLYEDLNTSLAFVSELQFGVSEIQNIVSGKNVNAVSSIAEPITLSEQYVSEGTRFAFLAPALLVLIIMITSLMLSAVLVSDEKSSPAVFRNFLAPSGDILQVVSILVTTVVATFAQYILFVLIALFFFPELLINWYFVLVVLLLCTLIFSHIGMFLGYLFSTHYNTVISSVVVLTGFILFSEVFIPLTWLPSALYNILTYSPFSLSVDLIRQMVLYDVPLDLFSLAVLLGYSLLLAVFVLSAVKSYRALVMLYHVKLSKTFK